MAEDQKENDKPKKAKVPTALKRDKQNVKKNLRNRSFKASVRTAVVSLQKSMTEKDAKDTVDSKLNQIYSLMDKGVKKGIFKKNKASRIKARFSARSKAS